MNGATLCPFPVPVKGVTGLADWIERHGVTVYASSASIFRNFIATLEEGRILPSVRAVRLSSEPATSDDFEAFRRHFPDDAIFVHSLSSSETGNIAWSRRSKGDRIAEGRLPIGLPTEGTELFLLDENGRPVGPNEIGEIVARSRYMSNGYWRDPELTAKRFSGPLDAQGIRQFRTGDLGRFNAEGLLEFCGRVDDRVKIRGNRIEPGEVEAALLSLPGIERAIVEAIVRTGKEPILVGFVKLQREGLWSGQDLRKALRVSLPDHMVPSDFVVLGSIPIARSGKIDREKLRASYHPSRVPRAGESPRTPTEKRLAEIWAKEFEVSDIGRNEDFFALGGDSLIAAIVAAKIYDERGVELNLAMFAEHPTVADLAQAIDSFVAPDTESEPPIVQADRSKPLSLSFNQERIWKHLQLPSRPVAYTMSRFYRIAGRLNVAILRDCIFELSQRHEILHTRYAERNGTLVQIIDPVLPPPVFQYSDASSAPNPAAEAKLIASRFSSHIFDIGREPPIRLCLIRHGKDAHWLVRVSNHIVSDNASWTLYLKELAALYEARVEGNAMPAPAPTRIQYADYAAWQRNYTSERGPSFRHSLQWWRDNLSGVPQYMPLPFGRTAHDPNLRPPDGVLSWGLSRETSNRLKEIGASQHATYLAVRLAGFAALLAAEIKTKDVVIGLYSTGRRRVQLLEVLGDFSNLLPLRLRYDPDKTFVQWLTLVRKQIEGAAMHGVIPSDLLKEILASENLSPPEVQVIFHTTMPRDAMRFGGLTLTALDRARQFFPWGFTIDFNEQRELDGCQMLFDPRMYDRVRIEAFTDRLKRFLEGASLGPQRTLGSLFDEISKA